MKRSQHGTDVNMLAINASIVLAKFGVENADYSEWRHLHNTLLKIMPSLSNDTARIVGGYCSAFTEARHAEGS